MNVIKNLYIYSVQYLGRIPIFLFGAAVNLAVLITLTSWTPTNDEEIGENSGQCVISVVRVHTYGRYISDRPNNIFLTCQILAITEPGIFKWRMP